MFSASSVEFHHWDDLALICPHKFSLWNPPHTHTHRCCYFYVHVGQQQAHPHEVFIVHHRGEHPSLAGWSFLSPPNNEFPVLLYWGVFLFYSSHVCTFFLRYLIENILLPFWSLIIFVPCMETSFLLLHRCINKTSTWALLCTTRSVAKCLITFELPYISTQSVLMWSHWNKLVLPFSHGFSSLLLGLHWMLESVAQK